VSEKRRVTRVRIFDSKDDMGRAAGAEAARLLTRAIETNGSASLIAATGASQFEFLADLVTRDVDWAKVAMFHLDEYIGLPADHPASFVRYLTERFTSKAPLGEVHFLRGDADPRITCRQVGQEIRARTIDVAFLGIGENGHLAFNDPPADFRTDSPYIIVDLDEACRRQQVGEGWFDSLEAVPKQAISMSINEILRARCILCTCPDRRKADAVRDTLEGPITPDVPASILRSHPDCRFFLDTGSASLLRGLA